MKGCMIAWFVLVQYFEFDQEYSYFANTISRALPTVGKYFLGVLPVFMGYAFLGEIKLIIQRVVLILAV